MRHAIHVRAVLGATLQLVGSQKVSRFEIDKAEVCVVAWLQTTLPGRRNRSAGAVVLLLSTLMTAWLVEVNVGVDNTGKYE